MKSDRSNNSTLLKRGTLWQHVGELYIRGLLPLLAILVAWYLTSSLWRYLDGLLTDQQSVWALLLTILLLPLPLGWLQHRYLRSIFERMRSGRALSRMEDRLVAELSLDKRQGYPVVIIDFPNKQVRSLGLITALVAGAGPDSEFAVVFLPKGPGHGIKGSMRVVNVQDLEYTDWSLQTFLQHHLSYGSSTPGHFDKSAWQRNQSTHSANVD